MEEQVTNDIAKQRCANDGGSLLLLKSREEADELIKIMGKIYSFNNLILVRVEIFFSGKLK